MNSTWTRDNIAKLLLEAADIALHYYDRPEPTQKADGSVVTKADHEIEKLLTDTLNAPENGMYLLGEETQSTLDSEYIDAALQNQLFIVDPIDGTAPYANRLPMWGISIGLANAGVLCQGAVYLPMMREMLISDDDGVWWLDLTNWQRSEPLPWSPLQPVTTAYDPHGMITVTQRTLKRDTINIRNPVQCICCAVMGFAYLAAGRYLAYLGDHRIWDLAGSLPIIKRLGFEAELIGGGSLGCTIDETGYCLEPGHPNRWRVIAPCLYAPAGIGAKVMPTITWKTN